MIASIRGTIAARGEGTVVVSIGGFGVEVHAPARTLERLGPAGDGVFLHTHLHVREDALTLYGFLEEGDRRMFDALIGVSGVGPRVAVAVLSGIGAPELAGLISAGDAGPLTAFPGIGRKTAERIVLELRDRIDPAAFGEIERPSAARTLVDEAVAALVGLGLAKTAAETAIDGLDLGGDTSALRVEDVVRMALKGNATGEG